MMMSLLRAPATARAFSAIPAAAVSPDVAKVTDTVMNLLHQAKERGYIGEDVSQQEHALQAAYFAKKEGHDDETVLGALLHDIGHLSAVPGSEMMGHVGIKGHEMIGGSYLRQKGFSNKVAELVESHVLVKRYLTYKDPVYLAKLSESSKTSLKYQGGPLPKEEAEEFERDPLFKLKVKLRLWDEEAKVVDMKVPDLETYRPMMIHHLEAQKKAGVPIQ